MLKLEKDHQASITLCVREKEIFFSPQFLKAALFAFLLHAGAYLGFHIRPFDRLGLSLFKPFPLHVEKEVFLKAPRLEEMDFPFLNPPEDTLQQLLLPALLAERLDVNPIPFPSFQTLEQRYLPEQGEKVNRQAMRLFLSGELAAFSIPLHSSTIAVDKGKEPRYVNYTVQVDGNSGKVFHTFHDGVANSTLDNIVLGIQFPLPLPPRILSGGMHFILYD